MQPVDPVEAWDTPPFEPTIRNGWLHARGASDDKGQVHFQLAAVRHLLATEGRLPVNVRFLVEGEKRPAAPTSRRSWPPTPTASPATSSW